MIDFELGWRAVPGFFRPEDGDMLQRAVLRAEPGTAVVELGAWCGRSLAAACEVLPAGVSIYSIDNYQEDAQTVPHACGMTSAVAEALRQLVAEHHCKEDSLVRAESSAFGWSYTGPPVSVLFIDDHHSYEHVKENLKAWVPRMAKKAAVLFHDYGNESYGIERAAKEVLPGMFSFAGLCSGTGVWSRV